jgi:hypothetical protein
VKTFGRFSSRRRFEHRKNTSGRIFEPNDTGILASAKFFAEWVKDVAGLQRVAHGVWQMTKLDLAKVQKAFQAK